VVFFAPILAIVPAMTKDIPTSKISANDLQHLKELGVVRRSDVYRYLETNYRHLIQLKVGTNDGPSWDETAALMSRRGYLNAHGSALNGHAVRRVFRRVEQNIKRRDIEAAGKTPELRSSRRRGNHQPPIAGKPPSAPIRAAPAQPPVPAVKGQDPDRNKLPSRLPADVATPIETKKLTIDDLDDDARAQFARLREDFAETDRKRFGRF
jgi:hypothetical protein